MRGGERSVGSVCGLSGVLDRRRRRGPDELERHVVAMAAAVRHRGPDDAGQWVDAAAGLALGHRRLAVLDLSPAGRQPMVSGSGRYVLAYNGEVYNFGPLRARLEQRGVRFRGGSDTEVVLASCEAHGVERTLDDLNGMFAFALWDSSLRCLHLVRDRLGEKPLYYTWVGEQLLFGSELRALRAHPDFDRPVDRRALALYLRHGCIPAPYSVFEEVHKLPPATHLVVPAEPGAAPTERRYWSARAVAEAGVADRVGGRPDEVVDELEALLGEAVGMRLEADVPLGAFLSGGVDSSVVVALMGARAPGAVRTFTVGFDDPRYDESGPAAGVADHLGTDHHELRMAGADVMALVPRIPALYDEPFADDSQLPTFLVSEYARRSVTVALSGDGGDELFAGYNRHRLAGSARRLRRLPPPARTAAARLLRSVPPARWEALFDLAGRALPRRYRLATPATKIQKLAGVLTAEGPEAAYVDLVSRWKDPASVVLGGGGEPPTTLTDPGLWARLDDPVERILYLDLVTYLPDDILAKVDRAAMAVGLETRIPFLDHRVVEFAWRVPLSMKVRDGSGKWLVRRLLDRYVPRRLVDRPKAGFGPPLGSWLRGPLRGWAEDLVDGSRLAAQGYLDAAAVRGAWEAHLAGRRDAEYELWPVLVFEAWLDDQLPPP